MAHFVVEYAQSGSAEAREAGRPAHIGYRKGLGPRLALAGPLQDEAGEAVGSLIIVEAQDEAGARQVAEADPYVGSGVLRIVSVRRFRIAAMNPPV